MLQALGVVGHLGVAQRGPCARRRRRRAFKLIGQVVRGPASPTASWLRRRAGALLGYVAGSLTVFSSWVRWGLEGAGEL